MLLRFHVRVLPWYVPCLSQPPCNAMADDPMISNSGSKAMEGSCELHLISQAGSETIDP